MITIFVLSVLIAAIVLAVIGIIRNRRPTTGESVRDIGIDLKRGARDSLNATKDAAEDAHNTVKDAVL